MNIIGRGSDTDPNKLERWLGNDVVENLSKNMGQFYWHIALHGTPGKVYAMPGGGFSGKIEAGEFTSAMDRADALAKRLQNEQRAKIAQHRIFQNSALRSKLDHKHHAFASLSALIAAASGGKAQQLSFLKNGTSPTAIGGAIDLWTCTGMPTAGSAAAAAPGGTVFNSTSAGALGYANAATANANHFTTLVTTASVTPNTLLAYDRLFGVAKTMNSTTLQAVSGVPLRMTSTTANNPQYAGGNFLFPSSPTTLLPATGHNWQNILYTNQAGTANQTAVTTAGISSCALHQVDLLLGQWFIPLQAGDVGIAALTQMNCSALVATGTIDFVIGHPICLIPMAQAYLYTVIDGINTAFNLNGIMDGASIGFMELPKPATTSTSYVGMMTIVSE